jgi:hypothetical protein
MAPGAAESPAGLATNTTGEKAGRRCARVAHKAPAAGETIDWYELPSARATSDATTPGSIAAATIRASPPETTRGAAPT